MSNAETRYQEWLNYKNLDAELKAELVANADNSTEIEDRFYRDLEFGTGGLRGVIGAGTNRMNIYTVAKATRGLAAYLKAEFPQPSCAIAYDSRNKSHLFAQTAAAVLAEAGVQVYLYPELMPTPMLSFAVRYLGCMGGIVITASHNPAKYNGYKVYGADGCQITLEAAEKVLSFITSEANFVSEEPSYGACLANGKIKLIDAQTIEAYYSAVLEQSVEAPAVPLKIVYSPLNGTGNQPVREILKRIGNVQVTVVPQQELPDGNFPTCPYPNPEIRETMELAVQLGRAEGADLCLATDPDCDRVGVAVVQGDQVTLINGNEMGVMLFDFICKNRIAKGTMPEYPVAVKTIVTTEMAAAIAKKYQVELRNVLTGFKFIGEQIGYLEQEGHPERYIFGFEESYGYLSGAYVRDKDAVDAAMLICEMAAHYKKEGKNLVDVLNSLYEKYGYYKSDLLSFTFEGPTGMNTMKGILDKLRAERPTEFAGYAVEQIIDYENDETGLPKSNVLAFGLAEGCYLVVRPSGTEPKLKIYVTAKAETEPKVEEAVQRLSKICTTRFGA